MTSRLFAAAAIAAALAASGCNKSDNANGTPAQPAEAAKKAGNQTIADALDKNGRFYQAAHAAGLDSTLAGPGPYTVLVPKDEAFANVQGALAEPAKPENRAELTRVLTYHILPGVILADDISKAIDTGKGKAVLATMGGQNLTATKDGGKIILSGDGTSKSTITKADIKASNGVIHDVDAVLVPQKSSEGDASGKQGG